MPGFAPEMPYQPPQGSFRELADRARRLEAQVARLKAALRPFAEAGIRNAGIVDDRTVIYNGAGSRALTAGDLRRAEDEYHR